MPETWLHLLQDKVTREVVNEAVRALFKRWHLHPVNQAELLGVADMSDLVQAGSLVEEASVLQRMGHLLAIDRALFKRYPCQGTIRDRWVWQPQEVLGQQTPLAFMLREGMEGIKRVRRMLESRLVGVDINSPP